MDFQHVRAAEGFPGQAAAAGVPLLEGVRFRPGFEGPHVVPVRQSVFIKPLAWVQAV